MTEGPAGDGPAGEEPVGARPVAVVTGGGRGIGRAVALALGAAGHAVCVNDTGVALDGTSPDAGVAGEVAAEIGALGGRALAAPVDARRPEAARDLVAEVAAWAGARPTVLVHAAGSLCDGMAHRTSDQDWDEVLGSHLGVAVQLSRAMASAMRQAGGGRIVYLGGAAGLVGSVGQAAYDVAKAGLFGLTRALALELARSGTCVNYLVPFAFTRMTESIPPATEALHLYLEQAPLARPEDVAPIVTWLCSKEAAGVSGQVIGVRGAEVSVWSQPRPVAALSQPAGWDAASLARAAGGWKQLLTPLESEFDLLAGSPPVPVTGGHEDGVPRPGTSTSEEPGL